MTAQEIMEPTPENRMVGYPYTKAMNANSFVDFGGALIICSAGAAQSLGIPSDKWVFPHAATDGHATYFFRSAIIFMNLQPYELRQRLV